jgi:hypothetical protein
MEELLQKYPRTAHLEGSRLQKGDSDHDQVKLASIQGQYVVLEEKVDAANSGVGFSGAGDLLLQSRGHYLTGGGRENQFALFKSWATHHKDILLTRLEDRYLMYGEWMFEKHTVYYDQLEHLFIEFDVWDKERRVFLSTAARRELLQGLPIVSAPVLYEGPAPKKMKDLQAFLGKSRYQSERWRDALNAAAIRAGVDPDLAQKQTMMLDGMEGGYLKIETDDETVGRLKWVRPDFIQAIRGSGSHHRDRILIPNTLAPGVDIFAMPYADFSMSA